MLLKCFLILSSIVVAQVHTGQSKVEQRVNEHMQKTGKKIEIEAAKKEVELKRSAPERLRAEPFRKQKKSSFKVYTTPHEPDPEIFPDQYDHSVAADPAIEFERDISEVRTLPTAEQENAAFVRQFKENAEKAGVKVHIDPDYKARPIKSRGTGR